MSAVVVNGSVLTGYLPVRARRPAPMRAAASLLALCLSLGLVGQVAAVSAPDPVVNLEAQAGDGRVTLFWAVPSDDGAAVTDYVVTYDDGGGAMTFDGRLSVDRLLHRVIRKRAVVTGLTNGQSYTFTVAAMNTAGTSDTATIAAIPSLVTPDTIEPRYLFQTIYVYRFGSAAIDPKYALAGRTVLLRFHVTEDLASAPSVTIAGQAATVYPTPFNPPLLYPADPDYVPDSTIRNSYTAQITVAPSSPQGPVIYDIGILTDVAGNTFDPAPVTTNDVIITNTVRPHNIARVRLLEGKPRQTAVAVYWVRGRAIGRSQTVGFDVQYRLASAADMDDSYIVVSHADTDMTRKATITGLTPDTAYVVRVRARASATVTSAWVARGIRTGQINVPPTAEAGNDPGGATEGSQLTLSGSGTDPEDDIRLARPVIYIGPLSYLWEHIMIDSSVPVTPLTITAADTTMPTFTVPYVTADTSLTFQLTVTDSEGASATDTVTVSITNANTPPTATAGVDPGGAVEGSPLTLSGSGTDPDGKPLSYLWEHIMTDSSAPATPLTITAADTTMPTFTVPYVTADTSLTFQLMVTDSAGASATDTVTVSITNVVQLRTIASISNRYPGPSIISVDWIQGSADDKDPTTGFDMQYRLASAADTDDAYTDDRVVPSRIGPFTRAAVITRLTAATAYVVRVRAVSGTVPGDWSEVSITTTDARPNTLPRADAGHKQPEVVSEVLLTGALVTLDGSRSWTAIGTITGYAWTQFSCHVVGTTHRRILPGAAGCPAVTLTDANTARPTFTVPDMDTRTDFIFALVVTDSGSLTSITDLVTIAAAPTDALLISLLTTPTFGGTPAEVRAHGTLAFRYLRAGDSITVTVRSNRPLKADTLAGSASFSVAGATGIDLVAGDTANAYSVSYDIADGDNTGPEALSLRISGVEDEGGVRAADTIFYIKRTEVDTIPPTLSIMQHADNDYVLLITPSGHSGSFSSDDLLYNGEPFGNTWSTTRADSIFCLLGSPRANVDLAADCRSPADAGMIVTNRFQVGDTFTVRENVIRDLAENGNAMVSFNVPTVPGAPADLRASGGNGQVTLVWNVPVDGGNVISGYQYRQATSSAALATTTTWTDTSSTDPVYTVTGLTNGTPYFFQVRAVNIIGESDASAEATATPSTTLSTDASLYDLTLSADTLTFVPGTTAYDVQVENSVASVTVTPTVTHIAATIAVLGASVTSGTASNAIDLEVGDTTITIVVTAENTTTMQTYSVVVTRAVLLNTQPVIATTQQTVMHAEHTPVTTVVATYALTAESMAESTDVGETIVWSLGGTDRALFAIDSATGGLTFNVSPDYENPGDSGTDNDYAVTVIATDNGDPPMSGELAVMVAVTNTDEQGTVAVTGTAQVDSTLTADTPADPDGSVSSISWQWRRAPSVGDGTYTDIVSATAATYTPGAADVGYTLQVVASYTDGHGSGKTATSAPTAMVVSAAMPAAPSIALAADTGMAGDDGTTRNAQVDVTLDGSATAWEYSTNSGTSYMPGIGTPPNVNFMLPEGAYAANQVQVRQTVGGEKSAAASLNAVTVDTTAPTVASFDDITGATADTQTTTTIIFSEAVTGLEATDFSISPNDAMTAVSGGPTSYTVTYTPTMVPFTLTLAANSVMDTAGNTAPAAPAAVQGTAMPAINQPPTASAGSAETVAFGARVTLDGSTSSDSDGMIEAYAWTHTDGEPSVTLTGADTERPTFTAPATAATLVFRLTVTDDDGAIATAMVTITVVAALNTQPVIATTRQLVMHVEHTPVTTVVATYALTTASMDLTETIVWSLGGTDGALFAIDSATGGLTFNVSPDYENPGDAGTDNDYAVTVIATDNGAPPMSGELAVTVAVTNTDEQGTVIITGTAQVGSTLTASTPEDPDGNVSGESWQWQRAPSGESHSDISGANSATYTLEAADEDNTLQVVVSYTDGQGSGKTATSAPTAMVVSVTAPAAPTLALAADTGTAGDDGITRNAQVDVTLDASATAWEYSTNSGMNYMTGSGTSFVLLEGAYEANQVQVRQTVGGEKSAAASLSAVTVDTTAPTVASFEDITGATAGMQTTTTITFSEAVTGLEATDFSTSTDATVTAVSGGPTSYTITYTPAMESFTLSLAANSVMDTAGNTAPAAVVAAQGTAMAPPSNDATLSSLTLSAGTLAPAFTSGTLAYSVSVINTVASITVTPTAADAGAGVTVNGDTVTSGGVSNVIDLRVSGITITIRVTAEDGSSTQSYTLTVSRATPPEIETEVALGALGRSLVQGVSAVVQGRFHARPAEPFSQASLLDVLSLRSGTGSTIDLEQLLRGVEFAYALGAAEDGGMGTGTALTVWGSGEWRQLSGNPEVGGNRLDYDGDSYSMHVGADVRIDSTLLGLSLGYNQGSLDYRGVSGTETLESDFVMLHPYVSRELAPGMMVWGTAGYGEGEVESKQLGQKSDASLWSVTAGLEGRMELARAGDVVLSATAAIAQTEVDGAGGIPKLRARVYWLRGEAQAGYRMKFGGGHVRPFLLGAVRHDAGDAGTGTAIEAGGGLELQSAHGLDVELRGRVQVNSTENEEHGLGGSMRYDRGRDGRGLRFSLSPALGATSQPSLDTSQPAGATSGAGHGASLRGELGYGMGARGGLWNPFGRMQWQGDSQRWSTGLLLQWRPGVEFELEAERHHTGGSVGHGGMFNTRLRF